MPHRPGTRRLLLAASGFCLALTVANPATAQDLEQPTDHTQCKEPPRSGDGSWCYPMGKEIRVILREPYTDAIGQIGSEERSYLKMLGEGRHPVSTRMVYGSWMGLSDAEDETMRSIMLEAWDRIHALQLEIADDGAELDRHYDENLAWKRFALIEELQPIYDEVPLKLRKELGVEAANRAEAGFRQAWGKLPTQTFVYFLRRARMMAYPGDWPLPTAIPSEVKHE